MILQIHLAFDIVHVHIKSFTKTKKLQKRKYGITWFLSNGNLCIYVYIGKAYYSEVKYSYRVAYRKPINNNELQEL